MGVLYGFLIVLEMLVCALLIVVIFMQKSKGGMGGSAFGGGAGEAIFGSRMGNVLTKATVVLGVIFLANTLVLTVMTSRLGAGGSVMESAPRRAAPQQAAPAPSGDGAGWMGQEMQQDMDLPIAVDIPGQGADAAGAMGEDVLVIPPAEGADVPPMDPVVIPDAEPSEAPDPDASDLGQ